MHIVNVITIRNTCQLIVEGTEQRQRHRMYITHDFDGYLWPGHCCHNGNVTIIKTDTNGIIGRKPIPVDKHPRV